MKNLILLVSLFLLVLSSHAKAEVGNPLKSLRSVDLKGVYPSAMMYDQGKLIFTADTYEATGTLNFFDPNTGMIDSIHAFTGCVFKMGDRSGSCGSHSIAKYKNLILLPAGENGLAFFETETKTTTYLKFPNEVVYSVDVANDHAYVAARSGHIYVYDLAQLKFAQTYTLPDGYVARDLKVDANGMMDLVVYNQTTDHHLSHPTIGIYDSVRNTISIPDEEFHPSHVDLVEGDLEFVGTVDDDDLQMDFVHTDRVTRALQVNELIPFADQSIQWRQGTSLVTKNYLFLALIYQKAGDAYTTSELHVFDISRY